MVRCVEDTARALACRDGQAAAHLKLISIWVIFFTSVVGISSPVMLARYFQGKPLYDKAVLVIKCFAAGVIMSTSLVHVLPDAFDALSDCRVASRHPWKDFPFSGLVTMVGALLALLVDITASSHVEHSQQNPRDHYAPVPALTQEELMETKKPYESRCEAGELGPSHELMETKKPYESRCEAGELEPSHELMETKKPCESRCEAGEVGPSHEQRVEELVRLKQRLVSQVLEIGIIFHSVIIGVTMGMSQNQCTIRPLVAALAFHQIFEGMGLGGCIAQAGFGFGTTAYMCFMFSVTTPVGIVMGMILFSATGYDDSNPNALIMEGLLGSFSSGILIYMALVDLIAVDFFHNKMMNSSPWMKKTSYIALTLGSTAMSILAIWA